MLNLLKFLNKKEWFFIFLTAGLVVVSVWLDLKLPSYMSEITEKLYAGAQWKDLLAPGGMMLLCAILSGIASVVSAFFVAQIAGGFGSKLRDVIYQKVIGFSNAEMDKFSVSSLITRTTNDVTQVQNLVAMGVVVLIRAPVMAIWAITIILTKSWQWTALMGGVLLALLLVVVLIVVIVLPKYKQVQKLTDSLNQNARENLNGMRVVRAFNAEEFQKQKFEQANINLTNNQLFINKAMSFMFPFMSLLASVLSLGIYWLGAYIIDAASLAEKAALFGDMIVFMSYAMQVVMSFIMLIAIFILLPRALVASKRINEVLKTNGSIYDGKGEVTRSVGEVEFRNVSFSYPNAEKKILNNISFKIEQGQMLAIIGSTGCGKSTLINLIPRLYDATEGEVLVDGENVKNYTLSNLNKKIAYVAQRPVLFSGTIKENLSYGDSNGDESDEALHTALQIAQASEFVDALPDGMNSKLNQGGANLSGGQKQRLSIARAIARKPEIIVFDDSFSALDYQTDKNLREALKNHLEGTTCVIVAQRISTIKDADKILVLDDGEIVGFDNHKNLMKNCKIYQEIALSQLSKEELK